MPDSLPQLEAQRTDLFRQLAALGDFRRGSITTTSGKCGKPTAAGAPYRPVSRRRGWIPSTRNSPQGCAALLAAVGSATPFDDGRQQMQLLAQQMQLLAGLTVTAKAVERTAEAIGADIAQGEQREIRRAVQLDLPVIVGEPILILYVQMDGTKVSGISVVYNVGCSCGPGAGRGNGCHHSE